MDVLIINTNRYKEPVPVIPVGPCMIAEAATKQGHRVKVLDLMFAKKSLRVLERELKTARPDIVGLSVRNIDNNDMKDPQILIQELVPLMACIRRNSQAMVVLGGPAVSIMPEQLLRHTGADWAVLSNGEAVFTELLQALSKGTSPKEIHGTAWLEADTYVANLEQMPPLSDGYAVPDYNRWIDVHAYLSRFSTLPILSKRGCQFQCIYCTYPMIEGNQYYLRPPESVVKDVQKLASKGLKDIEFVDSIFNAPYEHALTICKGLVRAQLDVRLQSLEMNPLFLDDILLAVMEQAGFVGIGVTVESASDRVLQALGKGFTAKQVRTAAQVVERHRIACLWIFLLGGPGETEETVQETLHFAENCIRPTDAAFFGVGIRIYPGTGIEKIAREQGMLTRPSQEMLEPVFYFSPELDLDWLAERLHQTLSVHLNFFDSNTISHPILPTLHRLGYWLGMRSPLWRHVRVIRRGFKFLGIRI